MATQKLRDIKLREISFVDRPANKQDFVFFKRQGEPVNSLTKKKKIKIEIESNGLVGGTQVTVNGEKLGKLRSFDFSFYGDDSKQPIHASYSKVTESDGGFSRTETYYLSKGEVIMDSKTLELLKEYIGEEDADVKKKVDEEELQKALELITKHYKDDFPKDLEKAVGILAINACCSEIVEKAGAKFSKDAVKKLNAVIAAVEALKSIMTSSKESTEKVDGSESKEMAELTKQLTELKEVIAKQDPEKKDDAGSALAELTKAVKEVSGRVEAMEKVTTGKKSIDDDDDDDDKPKGAGEDGEVLWKSIVDAQKD